MFDDIRFSSMDVKLGLRMLARYPGLTIVAGLTMAFAIGVGAGLFEVIRQLVDPTLPLPESERIVAVQYHDRAAGGKQNPHAYDVLRWRGGAGCGDGCADPLSGTGRRDGLASFEAIGAFLGMERNLSIDGGAAEPIEVAEISASAFRTTRTPALLGRTLVDSDEAPGAPPVVVLGYGVWQTRLDGDTAVLGRDVRIGDARMTVVGVMPKEFGFPVHHDAWVPLKLVALPQEPDNSPALSVFGRLKPAVTLAEAEAELSVRMAGAISEFPEHYEHLTPVVVGYAARQGSISPDEILVRASVYSINLVAVAFVVLMCGNVALLMFARAATRERELLVRNALGAGRARIVTQLFVEALVLGAFAAALGLAAAGLTVRVTLGSISGPTGRWPFWLHASLSPATIVYATGLAILASVIAGVIPALKVTGRDLETRLRAATAGAGGLRMGGIWNGIVRTQIAATVVFVAITYPVQRYAEQLAGTPLGFAADEYVAVRLEMDPANPMEMETDFGQAAFLQRYTSRVEELKRRIAADPAVAGVTVAAELPLMEQRLRLVEVDGATEQPRYRLGGEWVSHHPITMAAVDLDFFDAFGAPILAGRGFDSRDLEQGARTVVVNEAFVRRVLGGRNAVGQRIRQPRSEGQDPEPWQEIVGVVSDLVLDDESPLDLDEQYRAQVYEPLGRAREKTYPLHLAAHALDNAAALAPEFSRLADEVSPELRIAEPRQLDQLGSADASFWTYCARFLFVVSAVTLFLSLAGIYSVLSFTVSRRTREIGIRVALGAATWRIVAETFRRPFRLVASGVAIGCVPVGMLFYALVGTITPRGVALFLAFALTMLAVCALGCIVPTQRALRVQPTEALREE